MSSEILRNHNDKMNKIREHYKRQYDFSNGDFDYTQMDHEIYNQYRLTGISLESKGDFEGSIEMFNKSINYTDDPNEIQELHVRIGDSYLSNGAKNETFEDYASLTKSLDNYGNALSIYRKFCQTTGKCDQLPFIQAKIDKITSKLSESNTSGGRKCKTHKRQTKKHRKTYKKNKRNNKQKK
jgi:tetratricopeptide (TPR) repeat protein